MMISLCMPMIGMLYGDSERECVERMRADGKQIQDGGPVVCSAQAVQCFKE